MQAEQLSGVAEGHGKAHKTGQSCHSVLNIICLEGDEQLPKHPGNRHPRAAAGLCQLAGDETEETESEGKHMLSLGEKNQTSVSSWSPPAIT